jgi:hypothetical protein
MRDDGNPGRPRKWDRPRNAMRLTTWPELHYERLISIYTRVEVVAANMWSCMMSEP